MFLKKRNSVFDVLSIMWMLSAFLVNAAPITTDGTSTATINFVGHSVTVHGIVFSVIVFVTGAYLCFLGGVFQNFTMFIIGFYVGANVAYIVLTNAKADYGANSDTILLVVCIIVGVLCGGLLCCCFFLAVYLMGALLGYLAALWLLSWVSNGLIQSSWGRAVLIICFIIAGILLMAFVERVVFVIGSAFIGSFAIMCGVDIYVKSGFLELVNQFLHARSLNLLVDSTPTLRGMLAGTIALTAVGSLFQWCMIRRDTSTYRGWRERYPARGGWRRV
ncbi:hypothetical protein BY458DRAFT_524296 [Sporodiniella umbellata]|nr:hypothetical protein BY458DRAFT_524296 [Sporodiniella umbellata]